MKRRRFLKVITSAALTLPSQRLFSDDPGIPTSSVSPITSGADQKWFGYYDKFQIDPTGRYALSNQVDLLFHSPRPQDKLKVGLIDLSQGNAWQEIGTSSSWGWQQGCMLQWIPGNSGEIIWNDLDGDRFVSRIYNLHTGTRRTLPKAIYTLSPDGSFALCVDFDRLQFFRPGYGYPTAADRARYEKSPEDSGIFRMDLRTGESQLIISFAQIAQFTGASLDTSDFYHWFNHLLISPDGKRFIFLNRCRPVPLAAEMKAWYENNTIEFADKNNRRSRYFTHAFTANTDGSDIFLLNESGRFSHFVWKGNDTITGWSATNDGRHQGFYHFPDRTQDAHLIDHEAMPSNGHNTYVPGANWEWILNDTYPRGANRLQTLYLYHIPTRRKIELGHFHAPAKFTGEWRCDLHPRCDQQGRAVYFDSTHQGQRRQIYKIDIAHLL